MIYSSNESALQDGAGFWCNTLGWVEFDQATHFSAAEACDAALPLATGQDARFVLAAEAGLHCG
ncbi:hypothetical protein ANK1_4107 [plant metagenome]|uniref:Uncharacterized protein n=1 Tax=plant metagenome TaxID=1297885 RepID=A0A484Q1S6_9ZZZZ